MKMSTNIFSKCFNIFQENSTFCFFSFFHLGTGGGARTATLPRRSTSAQAAAREGRAEGAHDSRLAASHSGARRRGLSAAARPLTVATSGPGGGGGASMTMTAAAPGKVGGAGGRG